MDSRRQIILNLKVIPRDMPTKSGSAAHHPSETRRRASSAAPQGDVLFFIGVILFLTVTLGTVIVAQKIVIHYISREFPRVAEHNYRVLQANLRTVEISLTRQLAEVSNACIRTQQMPPPYIPTTPVPPNQIVP